MDDIFGKVLIGTSSMSVFTKLFQKHSYFLGVFFTANGKFKLKELLIFTQKDSRFQTDSSHNTTLFAA